MDLMWMQKSTRSGGGENKMQGMSDAGKESGMKGRAISGLWAQINLEMKDVKMCRNVLQPYV